VRARVSRLTLALLLAAGAGRAQKPPAAVEPASAAAPGRQAQSGGYLLARRPATEDDELDPAAQREAWRRRSGVRPSYEVRVQATGLVHPDVPFYEVNPDSGELESGRANQFGIGGGLGVRAGMTYFGLSDPATRSSTLTGFRLGAGLDGNLIYSKPPSGYTYRGDGTSVTSRAVDRADKAYFYPNASLVLGFHVGFGEYRTPSIWRGVVLGLAYAPAYLWALEIGETEFDGLGFNYGGVELTLDVVSLETGPDVAQPSEMQIRLFAWLLPRVDDELPWQASLGVGAVWY
jgi:hypothetical protein